MELLYFVLASYGLTFILVYGKIFEDLRPPKNYSKKWNTLFHCPLCIGFWVGCLLFLINGFLLVLLICFQWWLKMTAYNLELKMTKKWMLQPVRRCCSGS